MRYRVWKERNEPSLSVDDCLGRKWNLQNTPRMYEFSKVAVYKVNTQKSVTFLYTSSEYMNTEIRNTIPFIIPKINLKLR